MPRLPGRESTATKVPIERLLVASLMTLGFDRQRNHKRPCVVEGCGHRLWDCEADAESVSPSVVALDARWNDYVGYACCCCTGRILA